MATAKDVGWTLVGIGAIGCGVLLGKALNKPMTGCPVGSMVALTLVPDSEPQTIRARCATDVAGGPPRIVLEVRP